ncbi:fido domain-containing protein [Aspergillus transmontanensis]|uniref:Fido domain-containing protein n=1 Tax=Aspergillus transmontanensis TaxID=1034304 RepID=A0A5N6VS63_9EURO|nr:fido domain-containing protein [Aspergillus transmontanensis]
MENIPQLSGKARERSASPRRKTLAGLFDNLSISPSTSTTASTSMRSAISNAFQSRGWPPSISKASRGNENRMFYTISMDSTARAYIQLDQDSPKDLFKKATDYRTVIQQKLKERGSDGTTVIGDTLTRHLGTVIFGSNYIERAGLNLEETVKICESIFRGEFVDPEKIPERKPDYEKKLIEAIHSKTPASHIIRSRREVVQHALALNFLINEMVVLDKPLSEGLILRTHRILTEFIDTAGGIPWTEYSGKYRKVHVHAGNTNFVSPKFIPAKMRELVAEFETDVHKIEATHILDPFALAAKYCNDFVMIHPFADGNGRMCRLIMNAILLKYAGIVVCLGEHDESRQQYIDIQKRAGERMEGSGELASLILKKSISRYRTIKQKITGKKKG